MSKTTDLNRKTNIKQKTAGDVPALAGQPVMYRYEADSTSGQTVINFGFSVKVANKESFQLFVNGRALREGAANDFTFAADAAGNATSLTLAVPIASGLNIIALNFGTKREADYQAGSLQANIADLQASGLVPFVERKYDQVVPFTTINNRSLIPNLANGMAARFGTERVQVQTFAEMTAESGPNGERVYGHANNDRNLLRYVGAWSRLLDGYGAYVQANTTSDYAEITFYGTGLNILTFLVTGADMRVSVDGGAEGGNIISATYPTILGNRAYSANQVVPVASGLTFGLHTVKIRANSTSTVISGYEVVHDATLRLDAGIGYSGGKKIVPVAQTAAYNAAVTGTRGGRIITYVGLDGVLGQAFTPTNASQLNLASADHTNEEAIRTYLPREFGMHRGDDFSYVTGTTSRAFTLEDGTTTLIGQNVGTSTGTDGQEGWGPSTNSFIELTFNGTGLDVQFEYDAGGTPGIYTVTVDNVSVGTISRTATNTTYPVLQKLVSGLPYGTHKVRLARDTGTTGARFRKFVVYAPKKPTLPVGAIEIAEAYALASYAPMSVAGTNVVSTGVIRKSSFRELVFVGAGWSQGGLDPLGVTGSFPTTSTAGNYVEHTFFGTGTNFRFFCATSALNYTVSIAGSTNLSGFTTSVAQGGTGLTFTASTGVLSGTPNTASYGNSINVSGLTAGQHTIRVTYNSGYQLYCEAFDDIAMLHAPVSKVFTQQNTLPTGSCSLRDLRKFSPIANDQSKLKFRGVAKGITSNPTTTTAGIAAHEMALTVVSPEGGAYFDIRYRIQGSGSVANSGLGVQIWVDGQLVSPGSDAQSYSSGAQVSVAEIATVWLAGGVHHIYGDFAANTGTITLTGNTRVLTVEER